MTTVRVRPFHRRDRQQLADLVNAHAAAVVPGMRVSVSTVLSELERQSREFIVDPWVSERVTLVAEQHDRVAAAAHLLRFLLRPAEPPITGLALRRTVGMNGTRLSAVLGEEVIGYIEVGTFEEGERLSRHTGWADVGNLHVSQQYRRRGTATWLLGQAAHWLWLAQVERLLDYALLESPDPTDQDHAGYRAFLQASGFLELTRTNREWTKAPNTAV
jgi:GNAT superfamily N-acetyltransferase